PGSYVDVYALGVIALEMLTGQANYDRPPGERSIQQTICDKNPLFAEEPVGVRDGVSNLLFQMIAVQPNRDIISARTIASIAASLSGAMNPNAGVPTAPLNIGSEQPVLDEAPPRTATAVIALRGIRSNLEQQTLA